VKFGMKTLMISGAMIGFCLGLALGMFSHSEWPSMLWHACAAAAALGLLTRWWGRAWTRNLQTAVYERRVAEAAARQQNPSSNTFPKK